MKKKFLTVFAATALVALGSATVLTSCGENPDSDVSSTPSSSEPDESSSGQSSSSTPEVIHVSTVTLSLSKSEVKVGETVTANVEILPENASDKTYSLASSNTAVATIEGNVITAISAGTVTIKAISNDGAIEGSATLTITAQATSPTLTNEGESSYTVVAGQDLTLPTIKATSMDGVTDISSSIEVEDEDDKNALSKDGKTFNSKIAGTHTLTYYVEEGTDDIKYDELSITINVTPVNEETELDASTYDPSVAGTYGAFADGFQKGTSSKMYKGLGDSNNSSYISATEDGINGNSLIIDLNRTAGDALNSLFINLFGDYVLKGTPVNYEVSFDYKPLAGGDKLGDAYFGIRYDGNDGSNFKFIEDKTIGKVSHYSVKYSAYTFPENATKPGFFFFLYGASATDCIVAIDNFKITFSESASVTNVVPSTDELQSENGFTFNWNTKSGTFEGKGEPMKVSSLDDSIKNAITGKEGFGDNVMYFYGQGDHRFSGLDATNLIAGKKLRISFKYYNVDDGGFNMIVMAPGGITMNEGLSTKAIEGNTIKEMTWEGVLPSGVTAINFYPGNGNYKIYIGDLNVKMSDADPIPEDATALGHHVGDKWTNSGRKFGGGNGFTFNNDFATPESVTGDGIGSTICKVDFTDNGKDDRVFEWYQPGNKQIEQGHEYKITVTYYVESLGEGIFMQIKMDGAFVPSQGLPTTAGYHKETFTYKAESPCDFFCFYLKEKGEGKIAGGVVYFASSEIELTKI